nr:translocation/assembly module TamB domain-containing protein [Candidatus Babeliales bacterium]
VEGSILCDVPFVDVGAISGQIQLNYMVNRAGKDIPGFAVGSIKQGEGEFSVKTQDHSFILDPIKMKCSQKSCWCETMVVATAELLRYFQMPELFEGLAGTVGLSVKCDLFKILQTLQASVIFNDVMYQSKSIISGAKLMIVDHSKNGFRGIFAIQDQELFNVAVQFGKNKTTCAIENVQDLSLFSGYTILKNKCHIDVLIDQSPNVTNGTVKIEYDIVVQNDVGDQFYIKGEGLIVDGILKIVGRCNDLCFESSVRLQPRLALEFFVVKRDDALLIDVNTDPSDAAYAVGAIDFSVLRAFLQQPFQMSFAQQGSFVFKAYCKEGAFGATVQTHYAHIRVPYVYNVIQNVAATCEFNWIQKELMFKDIDIQLYEGKIYCSQAKVHFDKNFNIEFVHVPLMVHDVLLSWNKSIYGLVSGNLLAQKMSLQDMVLVQGQLMVQKAEIKENIFSTEFQDLLSSTSTDTWENAIPLCADVSLFTKQALQINTSFLTAQAVLGVNVKGPIQKTELSGTIKLLSGQLHFPYKPLEIVEGKLLFTAEQLLDPAIEFLAKGKVKRYHVSLKAWGTASDPHMQFESEPYLGEDQIMSLLLLGVEDQSLSLMIPAFLYQRLKDIMFGSALSDTKLKSIFDTMLQSLKYVRFIPQFTNQTGRGGVRGLFEIDATEHLQGTIDTNFTHLEDTKFDVDYAVADDVTLRLQKDGPSTYGGQVEFRWKFS